MGPRNSDYMAQIYYIQSVFEESFNKERHETRKFLREKSAIQRQDFKHVGRVIKRQLDILHRAEDFMDGWKLRNVDFRQRVESYEDEVKNFMLERMLELLLMPKGMHVKVTGKKGAI